MWTIGLLSSRVAIYMGHERVLRVDYCCLLLIIVVIAHIDHCCICNKVFECSISLKSKTQFQINKTLQCY